MAYFYTQQLLSAIRFKEKNILLLVDYPPKIKAANKGYVIVKLSHIVLLPLAVLARGGANNATYVPTPSQTATATDSFKSRFPTAVNETQAPTAFLEPDVSTPAPVKAPATFSPTVNNDQVPTKSSTTGNPLISCFMSAFKPCAEETPASYYGAQNGCVTAYKDCVQESPNPPDYGSRGPFLFCLDEIGRLCDKYFPGRTINHACSAYTPNESINQACQNPYL
ncbi:MAG: hypothetical protein AAGI66_03015 [Cyanobacteria bacterium P01_H01_bin.74]